MTAIVIVVMAAVSIPVIAPRYRDYQMRSAAWQIAGDLRLARQRAVTTRNTYRFTFIAQGDPAPNPSTYNTYVIEYLPPQGAVWVQETPPVAGTRKALAGPVRIDPTSSPASPTRRIQFASNGSVVPTGTVRIVGPGGVTLSIVVDQVGRVQVN